MAYARAHSPRRNRPFEELEASPKEKSRKVEMPKFRVKSWLIYALAAIVIFALLMAANGYQNNIRCNDIQVELKSGVDNGFLSIEQVKSIVGIDADRELIGEKMNEIDLLEVEQSLLENPFVKKAEVYKSLNGVLYVDVETREAMARIFNNDGSSVYLDWEGNKFPTTRTHSAHVMLIRGDINESVTAADSFACDHVMSTLPVMRYIYGDPFWNAMISEVLVKNSGEIILYPQVGNMEIEFGDPNRIEDKFENLRLFYDQVIKEVGWTTYKSLSVRYKGQVVGRK